MPAKRKKSSSPSFFDSMTFGPPGSESAEAYLSPKKGPSETAIVYCEGKFGAIDGKTANGLARHSDKYDVLSIIDSEKAGQDAGQILDGEPNGILICNSLDAALADAGSVPDYFVFGIASASGTLSPIERKLLLRAIEHGMNIGSELHELLNADPEIFAACADSGMIIRDVK